MAGSVNKVILVGNLGADPEVRSFQNGGKVCNIRIATSEQWKDRNTGDRQERTEWHNVAIFQEATASFVEQYLRKGAKVYVEGALQTRKWQDQSGNDRYTTEVVIRPFNGTLISLDSGGQRGGGGGSDRGAGQRGGAGGGGWSEGGGARGGGARGGGGWDEQGGGSTPGGSGGRGGFADDLDDDIPF